MEFAQFQEFGYISINLDELSKKILPKLARKKEEMTLANTMLHIVPLKVAHTQSDQLPASRSGSLLGRRD